MSLACANETYDYRERKEYQTRLCGKYQAIPMGGIETSGSINHFDDFGKSPRNNSNIYLFKIKTKTKEYVPSRPISINVYCDDDLDFAENENLAVCGTGKNVEDAIENLKKHIVHFYEYYRKMDEDKLMGEALRLKDLYADIFVESGNAN